MRRVTRRIRTPFLTIAAALLLPVLFGIDLGPPDNRSSPTRRCPPAGGILYYIVRSTFPGVGSRGQRSDGLEPVVPCD